ncbi:MAG: ThuA domain-containing protein [Spirochaetales bacterium]|nr:ThuA domain-containing protein [Spirochaetales bacterium]
MAEEKTSILFVTGIDRQYHDHLVTSPLYSGFLEKAGFSVTVTTDLDSFLPPNVKDYDVIMLNTVGRSLSPDQESGLLKSVIGAEWGDTGKPKGLIGIHTASCSFQDSQAYLRMLGAKFLTHPEFGPEYEFCVTAAGHPVMKNIENFRMADELYLLEPYSPFDTVLSCHYLGFERPVAWVKPYGRGKVFYLALGHGPDQIQNRSFQQILINAVAWAKPE